MIEHTIHIRYARHCGGGRVGRRRDRSNGDDSIIQPTKIKRHTYVSLQWDNLLSSYAVTNTTDTYHPKLIGAD